MVLMIKTSLECFVRSLSTSSGCRRRGITVGMVRYGRQRWNLAGRSPLSRDGLSVVVPKRCFISTVISTGNYEELAKQLGCSLKDANSYYKIASTTSGTVDQLKRNIEFFKDNGLNTELLFKNTWLLTLPTEIIAPKVYYLNKIGINSFTIGLLKFQLLKLMKVVQRYKVETATLDDRIAYLATVFNCSLTEITRLVDKHTFLLTMDEEKLGRIVAMFNGCGIRGHEIRNNIVAFRTNEEAMKEHVARAKEVGLLPIRAWMFHCAEETFVKKLNRFCDAKEVLGEHGDCATYLANRLKCQKQYVDYILTRNPKLLSIHPPKLKQMFDFLYEIGFNHVHICQFPVILNYKVEKLQSRHTELCTLGYKPKNLLVLCSPEKRYKRLVAKLKEGGC